MTGAGRTALVVHPGAELYGSDRVLLESATALVQDGWRVIVQVPGPGPLADALAAAGARVEQATQFVLRKRLLRPRGWPELARTAAAGIRAALRALRRHRPDVVLVNGAPELFNPKLGGAIAAVLATQLSRNPWLPFVAGMAALWGLR